jgi:NRAMP (natural resistance-associated macrophage protein)-like metal ion transporter
MQAKAEPVDHTRHSGPRGKRKGFLRALGPGLITGASDDDPSGIGTYSQTGAQFGYAQLWMALVTFPLMTAIQEMCARIALETGSGLAAIIREHYPKPILYGCVSLLFLANTINIGADLGAMAAAGQLLVPIPFLLWLLAIALFTMALEIFVEYTQYARVLRFLTLSLFAYVGVVGVVSQDWGQAVRSTLVVTLQFNKEYWLNLVAILGTTISPYLFFWQASQEVEEEIADGKVTQAARQGASQTELRWMRTDVVAGMFFSNLVMWCIVVATASTLFRQGIHHIDSAPQAAEALRPIAGDFAYLLFAVGIIGTGLLAVPILAGSAAYAVAETFRFREGLYLKWRQAPEVWTHLESHLQIEFGVRSQQGPQCSPRIKQMADNGNHTEFRASLAARTHLAQPRLALGMGQQVRAQLSEEEQGGRHQRKHPRPGSNIGNPGCGKAQGVFGIAKAFFTAKAAGILVRHGERRQGTIAHQVPVCPAAFFVARPCLRYPTALGIAAQTPQAAQGPSARRGAHAQTAQFLPLLIETDRDIGGQAQHEGHLQMRQLCQQGAVAKAPIRRHQQAIALHRSQLFLDDLPQKSLLHSTLLPFALLGRVGFPIQRHRTPPHNHRSHQQVLLVFGRPIDGHPHRPRAGQLPAHGLSMPVGLLLHVQAWIMQPARQSPAGRLKVGKVPRQCRLTTGPHHQQCGDKVAKRTALMPVCLRQHGVDIVLQASGQRVLCHGKPNSRTSSFS